MVDWEGAIRDMSEQGKAAACVPAAFKDAGIDVPQEAFMSAALKGGSDPLKLAQELGLTPVNPEGVNLQTLYEKLPELKKEGILPFIRIGTPTEIGVLGQHINSVLEAVELDSQKAYRLGGIPPFGKNKGSVFALPLLEKLVPEKDGLLFFKQVVVKG